MNNLRSKAKKQLEEGLAKQMATGLLQQSPREPSGQFETILKNLNAPAISSSEARKPTLAATTNRTLIFSRQYQVNDQELLKQDPKTPGRSLQSQAQEIQVGELTHGRV